MLIPTKFPLSPFLAIRLSAGSRQISNYVPYSLYYRLPTIQGANL